MPNVYDVFPSEEDITTIPSLNRHSSLSSDNSIQQNSKKINGNAIRINKNKTSKVNVSDAWNISPQAIHLKPYYSIVSRNNKNINGNVSQEKSQTKLRSRGLQSSKQHTSSDLSNSIQQTNKDFNRNIRQLPSSKCGLIRFLHAGESITGRRIWKRQYIWSDTFKKIENTGKAFVDTPDTATNIIQENIILSTEISAKKKAGYGYVAKDSNYPSWTP